MTALLAPALIALFSFFLRIYHLGSINKFIFDEVYYVDGARDLIKYGVEVSGSRPEFVVHPPVGKWLIGIGIQLFGDNGFGWRITTALIGSLAIFMIGLIAHKLFYSPFLTALASALMAVDGLALVHSRTALLDNFLAFFILVATYFWISRRYWLVGLFLGLALATKWSALYFIALFGAIALYRAFTHHTGKELIKPSLERVVQFALLPLGVYLLSWTGWFVSHRGWDRLYSSNIVTSFLHYHQQALSFHTHLTEKHSYQANPWSWLVMGRPTSFFYETPKGCGADSCSQEVLALGTPLLWWIGTIALSIVLGLWIRNVFTKRVDPALNIIVYGVAAGYLPWFFFQQRTVFTFYAIIFEPFIILALVYCARIFIESQQRISEKHKQSAYVVIAIIFLVIAASFIYFLPLFMGTNITYSDWLAHMWFQSWI